MLKSRLKFEILKNAQRSPLDFREIIKDADVLDSLSNIGILPQILELHSPSIQSTKKTGLGRTLCGIRGTRHKDVTCLRCKKKLSML